MKKTALFERHQALGAKLVPFAGFEMPIQYRGIVAEHQAVRTTAGLFDVSHMGEFFVSGPRALEYLQKITVNDVSALAAGQAQYSAMCYDNGGIVDDLLVYRLPDKFMVVVNAANRQKDYDWMASHLIEGAELNDESASITLVALQGPAARRILNHSLEADFDDLAFYHLREFQYKRQALIVARTGYTGELGFEIYGNNEIMPIVWDRLIKIGEDFEIQPAGLGARDTLRLEMKYSLYGNDIDADTNPLEAGLGWIVKPDAGDFIGREALLAVKGKLERRLVCLEMINRAIPRPHYKVFAGEEEIGTITSGTQSPSLKKGIALAYLRKGFTKSGTEITVEIRGKQMPGIVVKPPFYKAGTVQD